MVLHCHWLPHCVSCDKYGRILFFQDFIFFRPEKLPKDFAFNYDNLTFDEYILDLKEDVTMSGLHFKVDKPKG